MQADICKLTLFVSLTHRPPLHTLIMAAMLLHSSSVGVFQATSCTLRTLIQCHSKYAVIVSNRLMLHFYYITLLYGMYNPSLIISEIKWIILHFTCFPSFIIFRNQIQWIPNYSTTVCLKQLAKGAQILYDFRCVLRLVLPANL